MPVFCPINLELTNQCGDDFPLAGLGNFYLAPVRQIDQSTLIFDASKHEITGALSLQSAGTWAKLEGRVSTKDLATENAKDGGGNVFTITVNAVVANIDSVKSAVLEKFGNQKLVIIAELFELDATSGNRKAVVIGLDKKMGIDAGAMFNFNDTVEAEQGGLNGYNCVITAVQGESPRFYNGSILVEDGSAGTAVTLG